MSRHALMIQKLVTERFQQMKYLNPENRSMYNLKVLIQNGIDCHQVPDLINIISRD